MQRKEKVEKEIMETKRIDKQRMILDREIKEEEERKREYFKLKTKNKMKKIIEATEREDKTDELSPMGHPSSFNCNSPFQNLDEILGIQEKAPILPTLPPFLESLSVTITDPPGPTPVKSRTIEASILRQSYS